MLQWLTDSVVGCKNRLITLWQERFKHGLKMSCLTTWHYRYANGARHDSIIFGQLESAGSGHWPFTVFEFSQVTGERATWMLTVLGMCWGTIWAQDLDDTGGVAGPDYRRKYFVFSCINHQHKSFEEII